MTINEINQSANSISNMARNVAEKAADPALSEEERNNYGNVLAKIEKTLAKSLYEVM